MVQPGKSTATSQSAPPTNGTNPRWMVMVFMGADGVEGDADLSREADDDIKEMEKVGSSESLNIFVQLHRRNGVERHHIGVGSRPVDDAAQDATNGKALTSFIADSIAASKHHPSEHSMLVLWGHAYRFGIGPQTTRHGVDALDFAELASVLKHFQDEHKDAYAGFYQSDERPKLDIVAFDACDLASIEMAYQLHPFAKYLLASQIGIPLPGWPYDKVLERLKTPMGPRVMGPAELGSYIARRFCAEYAAQDRMVSLSMLDLQRAPQLFDLTEVLARRLAISVSEDPNELQLVHDLFLRSRTPDKRPFVDVAALCLDLMRNCRSDDVVRAAMKLGDVLITPHPDGAPGGGSATGAGRPFVVENCRNSAETAGLHGVSLYAPHVSGNHDWEGASHFYEKFLFAQRTLWSELVHALTLPD